VHKLIPKLFSFNILVVGLTIFDGVNPYILWHMIGGDKDGLLNGLVGSYFKLGQSVPNLVKPNNSLSTSARDGKSILLVKSPFEQGVHVSYLPLYNR